MPAACRRDRRVRQAGVPEQPRQLAADPGLNGIVCRPLVLQEGLRPAGIEAAVVVRQVHRVTHAEHLPRPEA